MRDRIVPLLYQDAARLDWQHITDAERSRQYTAWLADDAIGRPLIELLGPERARLWLKDGPLKEYSRALAGTGPYARHASTRGLVHWDLVSRALGDSWDMVPESLGIKPLHCLAETGEERAFVAWGPSRDFKHLLWAGLKALDDNTASRATVVVLDTLERPTPTAVRRSHERIARRCGLTAVHLLSAASIGDESSRLGR